MCSARTRTQPSHELHPFMSSELLNIKSNPRMSKWMNHLCWTLVHIEICQLRSFQIHTQKMDFWPNTIKWWIMQKLLLDNSTFVSSWLILVNQAYHIFVILSDKFKFEEKPPKIWVWSPILFSSFRTAKRKAILRSLYLIRQSQG